MIQYIIILFIFLFCSSLFLYKIKNKLFKKKIKILNKNKCPTIYGILIHSVIFFILFRFFLQFNNTKENIDLETTELDTKEDKKFDEEHSHYVDISGGIEDLIDGISIADFDVNEFLADLKNNYDVSWNYGDTKKEELLIDLCNNVFNNSNFDQDNNLQQNWGDIKKHDFQNITNNLYDFSYNISVQNIQDILDQKYEKEQYIQKLRQDIFNLDISINNLNSQLNN